jgi:hypothetical protein
MSTTTTTTTMSDGALYAAMQTPNWHWDTPLYHTGRVEEVEYPAWRHTGRYWLISLVMAIILSMVSRHIIDSAFEARREKARIERVAAYRKGEDTPRKQCAVPPLTTPLGGTEYEWAHKERLTSELQATMSKEQAERLVSWTEEEIPFTLEEGRTLSASFSHKTVDLNGTYNETIILYAALIREWRTSDTEDRIRMILEWETM